MKLLAVCSLLLIVSDVSFNPHRCSLAFITWTKQQLGDYATVFRKQVYSKDVDPKIVEDAIHITQSQSRKVRVLLLIE